MNVILADIRPHDVVSTPALLGLLPGSPREAVDSGVRLYRSAKSCPKGHLPVRRVKSLKKKAAGNYNTGCVQCEMEYGTERHKNTPPEVRRAVREDSRSRAKARREEDLRARGGTFNRKAAGFGIARIINDPELVELLPRSPRDAKIMGIDLYRKSSGEIRWIQSHDPLKTKGVSEAQSHFEWEYQTATSDAEKYHVLNRLDRYKEVQALGPAEIIENPNLWHRLPSSASVARSAGLRYYYADETCPHGHPPIRRAGSKMSSCVTCHRIEKDRHRIENSERIAEANRQKRAENPDHYRSMEKKWRARNRAKVKAKKMRRIAALERATPTWLTDEHWDQMNTTYEERDRISAETGVQHHVDHIVPLRGENVCGLHVPWNLRVIPAEHNARKGNKWSTAGVSVVDRDVLGGIAP